ncbi:TetR/AcrR family transcriptional regulator [Chitinimonas taiwanensis]|uniref:Transcriptional regulator, TetR family n=1 Tax=Chitinimonas taiwanensis DSM 18899 TaxID=1121279 RepID=A0A1K2HH12_9NEIS|nr:TetR/AcrR family transcriptional regulator [Chitinimonas taiwanensis]SFZ76054.1 transcriptional regulator, TetR family [Chitinimonas taiwanensis DSM 18899]
MHSSRATPSPESSCALSAAVTRWTRRKEARPGEIMEAALELFVARGFSATRMEEIARAAGVTAGTLYRYFANKEELLKAVIRDAFAPTLQEGEQLLGNFQGSAAELLATVIRNWWQLNGATRFSGIPKLMIAEGNNFPELARFHREEVIERGEALIARAIQYGITRGEFRPIPLDIAVKVVTAPVIMAMVWKHSSVCGGAEMDIEHYLDEVIATLIHGFGSKQDIEQPIGEKA